MALLCWQSAQHRLYVSSCYSEVHDAKLSDIKYFLPFSSISKSFEAVSLISYTGALFVYTKINSACIEI